MGVGPGFFTLGPALGHASCRQRSRGTVAEPAPVPHLHVRIIPTQPPLGEQRRSVGRRLAEPALLRLDKHVGQSRFQRDTSD